MKEYVEAKHNWVACKEKMDYVKGLNIKVMTFFVVILIYFSFFVFLIYEIQVLYLWLNTAIWNVLPGEKLGATTNFIGT